jgi:hypothetical protein
MSPATISTALDFDSRLPRTRGRTSRVFSVNSKLTEEELQSLESAAAQQKKTVSEWAREVLLEAAQRSGPDVVLVELVATRMLVVNMLKMLGQNHAITEAEYAKIQSQVQGAKRRVAGDLADQTRRLNNTKES